MNTFTINGEQFTEESLTAILRQQITQSPEYSHFEDAEIEFCNQNKAGDIFFYVSNDDGEDMMIRVSHKGLIYWDWNGQVMDD